MSLIKCRRCGEMFSDSYKTCPFCEEDDAYYGGRVKKRRSRRTETSCRKAPGILGPVVVLVLILLVLLVVWLLFGDRIKTALGGEKPPVTDVTPRAHHPRHPRSHRTGEHYLPEPRRAGAGCGREGDPEGQRGDG